MIKLAFETFIQIYIHFTKIIIAFMYYCLDFIRFILSLNMIWDYYNFRKFYIHYKILSLSSAILKVVIIDVVYIFSPSHIILGTNQIHIKMLRIVKGWQNCNKNKIFSNGYETNTHQLFYSVFHIIIHLLDENDP